MQATKSGDAMIALLQLRQGDAWAALLRTAGSPMTAAAAQRVLAAVVTIRELTEERRQQSVDQRATADASMAERRAELKRRKTEAQQMYDEQFSALQQLASARATSSPSKSSAASPTSKPGKIREHKEASPVADVRMAELLGQPPAEASHEHSMQSLAALVSAPAAPLQAPSQPSQPVRRAASESAEGPVSQGRQSLASPANALRAAAAVARPHPGTLASVTPAIAAPASSAVSPAAHLSQVLQSMPIPQPLTAAEGTTMSISKQGTAWDAVFAKPRAPPPAAAAAAADDWNSMWATARSQAHAVQQRPSTRTSSPERDGLTVGELLAAGPGSPRYRAPMPSGLTVADLARSVSRPSQGSLLPTPKQPAGSARPRPGFAPGRSDAQPSPRKTQRPATSTRQSASSSSRQARTSRPTSAQASPDTAEARGAAAGRRAKPSPRRPRAPQQQPADTPALFNTQQPAAAPAQPASQPGAHRPARAGVSASRRRPTPRAVVEL